MNTKDILRSTEHRSFPLPDRPWIMTQVWNDLLFAHWPLAPEVLRPLVPVALPLDTFDGQCWVGIVPFYMTHLSPRGVPPVPLLSQSAEFNVRTYVVVNGIPGVYFFSLDAENVLAVLFARMFFHLPYFWATMEVKRKGDTVDYRTRRMHPGSSPAGFLGSYRPLSPTFEAKPGSLEYWLVERYCLYTVVRGKEIFRADIQHRPWPLQTAELEIRHNSMASLQGITLPDTVPLLHFAQRQEVLVWPLHRVAPGK